MSVDLLTAPLSSILNSSIDGVFTTTAKGTIVWVNGAAQRMFGWSKEELLGKNINMIMPSPYKEKHDGFLAAFRPDHGITHVLGAGRWLEAVRKDGTRFPVEVGISVFEDNGERYFTGFVRDISERRAAENRLRFLATHDQPTGLPNGLLFIERVKEALDRSTPVAVIVLNVVGFWRVAERHGRFSAEHMIRVIACRLRDEAGTAGLVSRIHGESFAIMTADTEPQALAERLCAVVSRPIAWDSVNLHLSAAAGVAIAKPGDIVPDSLLQDAHAAASHSLRWGACGGVSLFTADLGNRMARESLMEERLRAAVAENGLSLALQPKVRARDGVILGAEALVRWHDDQLGDVSPTEFIPLAERSGVIGDLGTWVLRRSLEHLAEWQRSGLTLTIAVNLSAIDLRQPDLAARIGRTISETGCNPSGVVIELTESAMADDPVQATERLHAIKDQGVSLSLDDFGTGYSSLSYLRHFPIDSLKIDRSFVMDTPDVPNAVAVARTIVSLAQSLGMKTVAEGVETRAQASFLRELGVEIFQGFLFSKPVPPDIFRKLALAGPIG
ncbi:EAL domain-containing protein [Telmatospirillum sp.]|uniref:EAL domain-containing protein n=1 Tax=Telmatospirillum sp. TaxID=2079197 RepID=UPI0028459492|nr:EAL domain-containing protein [Telmatospirillum sp.]MDR3437891.1 EAL domain-containing protein [Telmatospirillum sp.]